MLRSASVDFDALFAGDFSIVFGLLPTLHIQIRTCDYVRVFKGESWLNALYERII